MRPHDIFQPLRCTGVPNPNTERFHVVCGLFVLDSMQGACWRCVLCLPLEHGNPLLRLTWWTPMIHHTCSNELDGNGDIHTPCTWGLLCSSTIVDEDGALRSAVMCLENVAMSPEAGTDSLPTMVTCCGKISTNGYGRVLLRQSSNSSLPIEVNCDDGAAVPHAFKDR